MNVLQLGQVWCLFVILHTCTSNDITFTCVHTPYKHSCLTHLTSQRCMASCRGPGSVCQSMGNVLWLNPWPPSLAVIHVRPSLVASVCSFSSTSQYREAAANQPLTEHDAAVFWQNAENRDSVHAATQSRDTHHDFSFVLTNAGHYE